MMNVTVLSLTNLLSPVTVLPVLDICTTSLFSFFVGIKQA